MRKYQTPNPEDCVVSQGAKQMIDGVMDVVQHLRYTVEEAKRLNVDGNIIAKADRLIDLNLDLVAIVCEIDKIQNGPEMEKALNDATAAAMEKHFMEHIIGADVKDSPARIDPREEAKAGGGSGPRNHGKGRGLQLPPDLDEDMDVL
jgi:hypothetical protein